MAFVTRSWCFGSSRRPLRTKKRVVRAFGRPRAPLAFALPLLLSACAVGPDYQSSGMQLNPFHNEAEVSARVAPAAPPLDSWWVGFKDPVLDRLITRALAQNLDISASIARAEQARAAADSAGAKLLPTIEATGQASALSQSLDSPLGKIAKTFPGYDRDQRLYDIGAGASWEIDIAGGLRRGEEAAGAEAEAADAGLAGTKVTVAADVADAYFQVRGYQARISFVQNQVDVDKHLLDLVRQLYTAGVGNDREVAQAEALLQGAQAALPLLRIALEAQFNRVDVLLGAQPGTYAKDLEPMIGIPAIPEISGTDGPTEFLRRRPDVIAAERKLAASNANIGVALADYYPKLSLSGLLGLDSMNSGNLFTAASFQPIATGAIRWRLFDFGKIDAEVRGARGANAESLAIYRQTVLRATEDVENSFKTLTQTEIRTSRLETEVQSLKRARDLSQQAYSAGSIPLTDVLEADRQLLLTQVALAENRANAARAAVRSFRSLGGGWALQSS